MNGNKEALRSGSEQTSNGAQAGGTALANSASASGSIKPYPFLDTFAMLTILMILPNWLSIPMLLFDILLGKPEFFESTISLFFKHNLKGLRNDLEQTHKVGTGRIVAVMTYWIVIDSMAVFVILLINPKILDYTKLFSKACLASRLTSTRHRHSLDAVGSSALLLGLEKIIQLATSYFEEGTSPLSITVSTHAGSRLTPISVPKARDQFTLSDMLVSNYITSRRSPMKLLAYRLSLSGFSGATTVAFAIEFTVELIYSILAIYITMSRLNPFFQRLVFFNSISKSLDNFSTAALPRRRHIRNSSRSDIASKASLHRNNLSRGAFLSHKLGIPSSATLKSTDMPNQDPLAIEVPDEISKSILPSLIVNSEVDEPLTESSNLEFEQSTENNSANEDFSDLDTNEPVRSTQKAKAPASFPLDKQKLIMDDVSSPGLVVAQNFENYCRVSLMPSLTHSSTQSASQKGKYVEKKLKSLSGKNQQPLWTFLNTARTMFGSRDLFSGDYYQHNALVATDPAVEGVPRMPNGFPQLFVWYTGETVVAFELRDVTLDQLLVRVNGIIWEHVSSARIYDRELVIVNGLSPLSQYDIDFIMILDNGELRHFASTTVGTIHQNRTLTESKHSTPLTTLQESVVTTQNAIDREKAKIKKLKGDWRKRSTALKNEIENLNNRANIIDESRNYKKVESLRQAVAKLDIEVSDVSKKSEEIFAKHTEIGEKYLDAKRNYESEGRHLAAFKKEKENIIEKEGVRITRVTGERDQLLQKKDKLLQRRTNLENEIKDIHLCIDDLKQKEIENRRNQRKKRSKEREQKYLLLLSDINKFEKTMSETVPAMK